MSLKDKHDQRTFLHYAQMGADGAVVAVKEIEASTVAMTDDLGTVYVDVTDLFPYDLSTIKASAVDVAIATIPAKIVAAGLQLIAAATARANIKAALTAGKRG